MSNLLVVDFDYFFPVPERGEMFLKYYDWGHNESMPAGLQETLWSIRASDFLSGGHPLPQTSGLENTFWDRFTFADNAEACFADSNVYAYRNDWLGVDNLYLFDAHHDCGYRPDSPKQVEMDGFVTCEDWMILYAVYGTHLKVFYPKWRTLAMELEPTPAIAVHRQMDHEQPVDLVFDRLFVCRSGSWVPPWLDAAFDSFLASCPVPIEQIGPCLPRKFSLSETEELQKQFAFLKSLSRPK